MRWVWITLAILLVGIGWWCYGRFTPPAAPAISPTPVPAGKSKKISLERPVDEAIAPFKFTSMAAQSGMKFQYYGSPTARHFMTEQNGGGVAILDFDGDGTCDLFFPNGSNFDALAEKLGETQRLFQQTSTWNYHDVTSASGLTAFG